MNLPNKLTLLRMALVPVFIACFYIPTDYNLQIAAIVFVLAYITDIVDGAYARKHDLVTNFGKLMDPMADKLLTGSAMIMMLGAGMFPKVIGEIYVVCIIGREFVISGIRLVAAQNGTVIAAGSLGKLKTIAQCVTVVVVLLDNPLFSLIGVPFDMFCIGFSFVLTIWSLVDYIIRNRTLLR